MRRADAERHRALTIGAAALVFERARWRVTHEVEGSFEPTSELPAIMRQACDSSVPGSMNAAPILRDSSSPSHSSA